RGETRGPPSTAKSCRLRARRADARPLPATALHRGPRQRGEASARVAGRRSCLRFDLDGGLHARWDRSGQARRPGSPRRSSGPVGDPTRGHQPLTMRLQPVSDLHLEFDQDHGKRFAQALPVVGDVLVLAGDILPIRRPPHVREMLGWFCDRFPLVVYVPGTHEYYKTSPTAGSALLAPCARDFPNLKLLDSAVTEIEGMRFVGTTLWFPPTPDEEEYRGFLADFALIENFV